MESKKEIGMKKRVLIFGGTGMLGQELFSLYIDDASYGVLAPPHAEVDFTDKEKLLQYIADFNPKYIINAAAYNAVDACEDDDVEYQKALFLNKEIPQLLASASKKIGAVLVHFSTDYVFGKNMKEEGGFSENTQPQPDCRYGQSKYEGEEAVKEIGGSFYIIRLSRLFGRPAIGSGKKSFFEIMLQLSKVKSELQAVDDEISCFTYAPDLAVATKQLLESSSPYGVYHFINEGEVSWFSGLQELFASGAIHTPLIGVRGSSFKRKAKRPKYSALANTKRPKLRSYKEAAKDFLESRDISPL